MASLINRCCRKALQDFQFKNGPVVLAKRGTAIPPRKKPKPGTIKHRNLINSTENALAARGFLRFQKPYDPPNNAVERVKVIIKDILGDASSQTPIDRNQKFDLLNACFKEFNHSVPNSLLRGIKTPMDVLNFYTTAVSVTNPYDAMKTQELPPNLHIQYDYVRFHPETDTLLNGITAYPESSTIVTGLRSKNKYKGHQQRPPVNYDAYSDYIRHDAYEPLK